MTELNTTTQKTSTTSNCAVYEAPDIEGQTQVLTGLYIDGAAFGSVEDAPEYLDVTIGSDENVSLEPDGESANYYQFASANGVIRGSYVSKDEMSSNEGDVSITVAPADADDFEEEASANEEAMEEEADSLLAAEESDFQFGDDPRSSQSGSSTSVDEQFDNSDDSAEQPADD
jgi:hypothetical protein